MGAAQGFVATRPDARYGDSVATSNGGDAYAQPFTAPSSGTLEISEIGLEAGSFGEVVRMAIFENDAVNECPGAMVANSNIEVTLGADYNVCYGTYSTKPTITGGGTCWIGMLANSNVNFSRFDTGGDSLFKSGETYPTWPTDTGWHTHDHYGRDYSFYAVYSEVAASQFARPLSDVAGGTFRSILVTAPFGPRVIA